MSNPIKSAINRATTTARHAALTLPQVYAPQTASKVVRAVTGGSSKNKAQGPSETTGHTPKVGFGTTIGEPGNRYEPPAPSNGRTDGVVAAQFAAAQPVPNTPLDRDIKDVEAEA